MKTAPHPERGNSIDFFAGSPDFFVRPHGLFRRAFQHASGLARRASLRQGRGAVSPPRSAYTSTPSGSVSSRRAPCRAVARLASPNRPRMAPLEEFVASRLRAWRACPVSRPFVVRPLPAVPTAIRGAILRRGIPLLVSLAPRVTTAEPRPAVSLRSTRATPAPLLTRRLKPVTRSPSLLVGFPSSGRCREVPTPFPCAPQAEGAGEPRVRNAWLRA